MLLHPGFFCTVCSSSRLWTLEHNPLTNAETAATGGGKATGNSGGWDWGKGSVGGRGYSSLSTLIPPSFRGPLYLNDSQSWLIHQNPWEVVCLFKKNLVMYFHFLTFYYRFSNIHKGSDNSIMKATYSHPTSTSWQHFVPAFSSNHPHFFTLFWIFKSKSQSSYGFTRKYFSISNR